MMKHDDLRQRVSARISIFAGLGRRDDGVVEDLDVASSIVEDLFDMVGHEDLGEIVAGFVDEGALTVEQGADLLGISAWCGSANGAELQPTLERWLDEGDSFERAYMALHQGVFPFVDAETMSAVLGRVGRRFPTLENRCMELVRQRRSQGT